MVVVLVKLCCWMAIPACPRLHASPRPGPRLGTNTNYSYFVSSVPGLGWLGWLGWAMRGSPGR